MTEIASIMKRSIFLISLFLTTLIPLALALQIGASVFDRSKSYYMNPILLMAMVLFGLIGAGLFTIQYRLFVYQTPLQTRIPNTILRISLLAALLVMCIFSFLIKVYIGTFACAVGVYLIMCKMLK